MKFSPLNILTWIFICLQSAIGAYGQSPQPGDPGALATAYTEEHFPEKIFIHTDKDVYMAGDILWCKLYYVDGFFHHALEFSKTAFVDLVNSNGTIVSHGIISLEKGLRKGSFLLPLGLQTGNYRLRGYTNWMKNEGDKLFFEKLVTIINPIKDPDSTIMANANSYKARFFPEGGNLVAELESRIGFSITDAYGVGRKARGSLLNDKNDTLIQFQTYRNGLGHFNFTPHLNEQYRVLVRLEDSSEFMSQLPKAKREGCVMNVKNEGSNYTISINSNLADGTGLQLTAINHHLVKFTGSSNLNNGRAEWVVEKKLLGEGISQLTVFSSTGPECERLVFNRPSDPVQPGAKSDKRIYGKREQVSLQFPAIKNADSIELSVSVHRLDSLSPGNETNLYTYLHLLSELRGTVEDPGFYFSGSDSAEAAMENLLLTHGWRRFRWQDVQALKDTFSHFLPEYNGHLLSIRLTDSVSGQPVPGRKLFLSIPGSPYQFHMAQTRENGIAQFDIPHFFGEARLILRTDSALGKSFTYQVLDPFYPATPLALPRLNVHDKINTLEERSLAMQVLQVYSGDSLLVFYNPPLVDSLPFFGKSNFSYALDDYRRFTTMEDVMREYVREINVIVRNGKLRMRLFDQDYLEPRENDLLVLWDGLPIDDPNKVFNYDPLLMKKLDVIPRGFSLNAHPFNGLLSFTSYDNSFPGIPPAQVNGISYEGMQLEREFFSPEYATPQQQQSHIPDFRHTLYWNPNIILNHKDREVKFYTGDLKGKFRVDIQGIDAKGRVALQQLFFEIK